MKGAKGSTVGLTFLLSLYSLLGEYFLLLMSLITTSCCLAMPSVKAISLNGSAHVTSMSFNGNFVWLNWISRCKQRYFNLHFLGIRALGHSQLALIRDRFL